MVFIAETPFGHIGLGSDGIYYDIRQESATGGAKPIKGPLSSYNIEKGYAAGWVIKLSFIDGRGVPPIGIGPVDHRSNYFIGNDGSKWVTGAANYRTVVYPDLWPGIDLRYSFETGALKYEFLVRPGTDPSRIGLEVAGAELDAGVDRLTFVTPNGELNDAGLFVCTSDGGQVSSSFAKDGTRIGFKIGPYDPDLALVIDPVIFSTLVGGMDSDSGYSMCVDDGGHAYVTGATYSADFPNTTGAYDNSKDAVADSFVFKVNATGSGLVYATYLGGDSGDWGFDMAVDDLGCVFVAGSTGSIDFPTTPGAPDTANIGGSYDAWVAKLNSTGSGLLYSTYLGGDYSEEGEALAIDLGGNAYIAGSTNSLNFPTTPGAYDRTQNNVDDAFVSKLNANGTGLVFSTYIGGNSQDAAKALAVDGNGNTYVTGHTMSTNFPTTPGAFCRTNSGGGNLVFVTKLNATGAKLLFSTYIGGSMDSFGRSIDIDSKGNSYITGTTTDPTFPTTAGAYDTVYSSDDGFVTKLNASGDKLVYSTYLGGNSADEVEAIDTDTFGYASIIGTTSSADFPTTPNALNLTFNGARDAFLVTLALNGSVLTYSTFFGGTDVEKGTDLASDAYGNIYLTGETYSTDFPTTPLAYGGSNSGMCDVFVTKIGLMKRPSCPLNLDATFGDGFINLSWDPPIENGGHDIIGYTIYRNGTTGAYSIVMAETPFFNDTGVTNGVSYTYNLTASNSVCEGNHSIDVTVTAMARPDLIDLVSVCPGNGFLNLTWDPSPDGNGAPVLNYLVYKGDASGAEVFALSTTERLFNDTSVSNGRRYYYQVSAVNLIGESPRSLEVDAVPGWFPGAPSEVLAYPGNGDVVIAWSPPSNTGGFPILNYTVYRGTNATAKNALAELGNVTSYHDMGLVNGQRYHYSIRATNLIGDGPASSDVNATPGCVPSSPFGLTACPGDGHVNLTWTPPQDLGGSPYITYAVLMCTDNISMATVAANLTRLWYNCTGLVNGHVYFFKVQAFNPWGEGNTSNTTSAMPRTMPSQPLIVSVSAGADFINISWERPLSDGGGGILGYNIYRVVGTAQPLYLASTTDYFHNDSTAMPNTLYRYFIRAHNIAGEGPDSAWTNASLNRKPVFVSSPQLNATVGALWTYVPVATDADSADTVSITLEIHPEGMSFIGGVLNWTPIPSHIGDNAIRLCASDGRVHRYQDFTISVMPSAIVNRAPLVSPISDMTVFEGNIIIVPVQATDPDNDSLTYRISSAPGDSANSTIDINGVFKWDTKGAGPGTYPIMISVSDSNLTTPISFDITVKKVDEPEEGGGTPLGLIVVVIIAVLVALILIIVAIVLFLRKKRPDSPKDGPGIVEPSEKEVNKTREKKRDQLPEGTEQDTTKTSQENAPLSSGTPTNATVETAQPETGPPSPTPIIAAGEPDATQPPQTPQVNEMDIPTPVVGQDPPEHGTTQIGKEGYGD